MTARVDVRLPGREYPILIGPGLLADPEVMGRAVTARDVLVVTNEIVGPLYLERVSAGFAGRRIRSLALPDGEAHKTLDTASRIFDALVAGSFNRDACIASLGGGVVCDMAGFAAACYQRGVDFLAAPMHDDERCPLREGGDAASRPREILRLLQQLAAKLQHNRLARRPGPPMLGRPARSDGAA